MNIEELVLKYATLMPVRFKFKQKYIFINEIAKEYQALGYDIKAVVNSNKRRKALNLMVGDVSKASTIVVSNYDTPQKNYGNPLKYYPLNGAFTFARNFVAYYTPLILGGIAALFIMMLGMDKVDFTNNFWQSLLIIVMFVGSIVISTVMTKGVANKFNYNRNTSGVIGSLLLAEKLSGNKDVAFILTDMGCMGKEGDKMVQEALPKTLKDKNVIILDCIGNGARVGVGYRPESKSMAGKLINEFKDKVFSIEMDETALKYSSAKYYEKAIVVSYGKKQNDDFIVDDTSSNKDINIDDTVVKMIIDAVARLLKR